MSKKTGGVAEATLRIFLRNLTQSQSKIRDCSRNRVLEPPLIEMQLNTTGLIPPAYESGGFMDPDKIAGYFGLVEGMKAADFGSGAGYFTILMAKRVGDSGEITAVDIMNSALETLRAKAKVEGLGNIRTVRSNLETFGSSGLTNDSQDVVLIANTLFQNPNKDLLIDEARRALKPGSSLVIIEWKKGTGGFGPPDDLRIDEEEMKRLILASNGFQYASEIDAGVFHYGMIFRKI